MIVSNDAIYVSMVEGQRLRISWSYTLDWAVKCESAAIAMALAPDSTFLLAGAANAGTKLFKVNSSNGNVISSH